MLRKFLLSLVVLMSQRERGIRIQQLVLKIIKQVIEEKASRFETKVSQPLVAGKFTSIV